MVVLSTHDLSGLKVSEMEMCKWLDNHDYIIERYCDENFDDPSLSYRQIFKDIMRQTDGRALRLWYIWAKFIEEYDESEAFVRMCHKISKYGGLYIILGGRGAGKTTLTHKIVDYIGKAFNVKATWFGIPANLPPIYSEQVFNEPDIPDKRLTVSDESGIIFFSRTSGDKGQADFIKMLPITRQKRRTVIFIVQNIKLIDINIIRQASGILFLDYESFNTEVRQNFKLAEDIQLLKPKLKGEVLFVDNEDIFMFKFDKPSWWLESYSTPFAKFKSESERIRFILTMIDTCEDKQIVNFLHIRNHETTEIEIAKLRIFINAIGRGRLQSMEDSKLEKFVKRFHDDTPIGDNPRGRIYNFDKWLKANPVMEESWRLREKDNDSFALAMSINRNLDIEQQMKTSSFQRNFVISIRGGTGTRKSSNGIGIAEVICKWHGSNIHYVFKYEEILEAVKKAKRHDVIIVDEDVKPRSTGANRIVLDVKIIEETLRKEQIHLIFISPRIDFSEHLHHFILETYSTDERDNVSKLMVFEPIQNKLIGYITVHNASKKAWDEYSLIKDQFTKIVKEGKVGIRNSAQQIVSEMMEDSDYFEFCKSKDSKIAYIRNKYPQLGVGETIDILETVNFKKRKESSEN